MLAKEIMTKHVKTVPPSMTIAEVAKIFLDDNISGLPVVDEHHALVGIITEGDLLRQQKPTRQPLILSILDTQIALNHKSLMDDIKASAALTVQQLMSENVIAMDPEATIEEMAKVMIQKGINRIPIVDGSGKLLGIVTRQDIIRGSY